MVNLRKEKEWLNIRRKTYKRKKIVKIKSYKRKRIVKRRSYKRKMNG